MAYCTVLYENTFGIYKVLSEDNPQIDVFLLLCWSFYHGYNPTDFEMVTISAQFHQY
jgi:hypothetical protein